MDRRADPIHVAHNSYSVASRLVGEIHTHAGEEFNVNSTPQLRTILFEKRPAAGIWGGLWSLPLTLSKEYRAKGLICGRSSPSAPLDSAEAVVTEERVEDPDRTSRLRAVADVGVERVAPIQQVPH